MRPHGSTPPTGQEGTSLVELVIAATVVISLLMAISTSTATQARLRKLDEERNLAMVAIRNTLESMHDVAFAQVPALNGTGFDVLGTNGRPSGLAPVAGDADGLPGSILVQVDQSSGTQTLYQVTLAVDWNGVAGNQHFAVVTLLADRKS